MRGSLAPTTKGRADVQRLLARLNAGSAKEAAIYAQSRWGSSVALDIEQRAAVAATTLNDAGGGGLVMPTLVEAVFEQSVVSRFRRVPFLIRLLKSAGEAVGYWVGEGKMKPLTRNVLIPTALSADVVAAIQVFTVEAIRFADPITEAVFQRDLVRGIVTRLNQTFVDPAAASVSGVSPASITNGVTPIASVNDPVADISNLFGAYLGDFETAIIMTDGRTAARLAAATNSAGVTAFPGASARGGDILGVPLVITRGSPVDSSGGQIVMTDTQQVSVALGDLRIDKATGAALEMESATGDPSAATVLVSLFQNDLVALRAEIDANWEVAREGVVALVNGVNYSAG
jgi:HK97 family phage major capsid protein